MKNLTVLLSLTNNDNDYQVEQAVAAREAARQLGITVRVVDAANDAINQSQQLLKAIQSGPRPDAIVFEPAGTTAMPQVARAAVSAGIGWVVLNWEADYISELRKDAVVPVFALTSDHAEIGRIQGRQIAALLPRGGCVLCIQGPSASTAARQRSEGLSESKPANVDVRALRGQWTEESATRAVTSWLSLSTSRQTTIDVVAAQDDSMAMGARRAFEQVTSGQRQDWIHTPFIGCDGLPNTGQSWVDSGLLAATVVIPPNAGLALRLLADAYRKGAMPQPFVYTEAFSYPAAADLASRSHSQAAGR
jgi:ribose transport system substrate-binding protein